MENINTKYNLIKTGFKSRKTLSLEFRRQQLRNLYYAITDNEELLTNALLKDLHRSQYETEILELNGLISEILLAITNLDSWAKDGSFKADVRFALNKKQLIKEPYGLVLVIGPWNYPLQCTLAPLVSAIAAGNTVMVKPTDVAVNTAAAITYILEKSLDPQICQVVNGGVPETTEVLKLKFDKIMFTGSNKVGQIVAKAAANQPIATPVVLELGGKSPTIVFKDADLKLSAKRLAWAKFANAGQTCIAPDYCIVDKSVASKFYDELKRATMELYPTMSDSCDDYAHIVSDRMFNRLNLMVNDSKGDVWSLGKPNKDTRFIPPTIVRNVKINDSLMKEEIFGPILPLLEVNNVLESVDEIVCSQHDYPLACYIFGKNQFEINQVLRNVRTGAVMVNDALQQGGSAGIPFGGVGGSGMGRYHGKYGFDEFTHEKPVIYQPSFMEKIISSRYPPFTSRKAKIVKSVSRPSASWLPRDGNVKCFGYYLNGLMTLF